MNSNFALATGFLLLTGFYVTLGIVGRGLSRSKEPAWVLPMKFLLARRRIWLALLPKLQREQAALAILHSGIGVNERLLQFAAEGAASGYLILWGGFLLGWLSGSSALAVLGLIAAALTPILKAKELRKKLEQRRHAIVMELPELLNRLLLLVNAGENVLRALERCLQQADANKREGMPHPLYAELEAAIAAVNRGEPLGIALEEFGRRCAVPEAKQFATTLLLNARRGGDLFVAALRELSRSLWEKRKAAARMLGEQASSRLAFPLAVIFLLIMVLVGTPSFLLMSAG